MRLLGWQRRAVHIARRRARRRGFGFDLNFVGNWKVIGPGVRTGIGIECYGVRAGDG